MAIVMDDSAKDVKAIGNTVILKLVEVQKKDLKSKTGLILPGKEASAGQAIGGSFGVVYRAYIYSVGEKVDLSQYNFKVGDWVVFNNMDVMGVDLPDPEDPTKTIKYGFTKPESIWGVYTE